MCLSYHCGIETQSSDGCKQYEGCVYRTIVELKPDIQKLKNQLVHCVYRTIVELKLIKYKLDDREKQRVYRTIVELKLDGKTGNDVFYEVFIVPLWNWNTGWHDA